MTHQEIRNELSDIEDTARRTRNRLSGAGDRGSERDAELANLIARLCQVVRQEIVK
jgi:hypothetical protein